MDLTGVWDCDDGGIYYIRQIGDQVWWYGEKGYRRWDNSTPSPGHINLSTAPEWSNIAKGKINGNTINLEYTDVPNGKTLGNGSLTLNFIVIVGSIGHGHPQKYKYKLQAVDKTEGYGGSNWFYPHRDETQPPR